uniref:Uncharacterized protein n=1 Tax=Salarias fasciatus TaxID=181472 RepID=A0A672GGW0_SALFA
MESDSDRSANASNSSFEVEDFSPPPSPDAGDNLAADFFIGTRRCACGHCSSLSPAENICWVTTCITQHPGFEPVSLNPYVLQAAYAYERQIFGETQETMVNRLGPERESMSPCSLYCLIDNISFCISSYRHLAYRNFVR